MYRCTGVHYDITSGGFDFIFQQSLDSHGHGKEKGLAVGP